LEKRFESYDWLKAIGSMVFLVGALLPWWEQGLDMGAELRKNGINDWLGIIATVIFLAIGILTVIVETESLPIPHWVLNPTWMLGLAIVGAGCVAARFFLDPLGGGEGLRESRGIGLYLAGAGAVIVLIGCVLAYQRREDWAEAVARDDDDDEDEDDDVYDYGYDADEQDELIRRINESMERQSNGRRRRTPEEPEPTVQQQRRAQREERAEQDPTRRRRPTGPPIP
jgi:hypothetical protein